MGILLCQALANGCQGQVSAGCRAHMQWEVLSTAAFPLQDCSWGLGVVSSLSQGWRQTPWRQPRLCFMASRSRETQRQSRLALPGLTGQRPSFPDPETSWAPPGHPSQVSQIRPDCFLTPHITHTPGNTKQRCGCAPQIHPCLQVFNWFHSALLHANFFQNDLSRMMGWEVFWGTTFKHLAAWSEPCAVPPTQSLCCRLCSCIPASWTSFLGSCKYNSLAHFQTLWQSSSNSP